MEPSQPDAVILTHAHLDHSGRLPLLVKAGFKEPIYTHRATRDLCRIMLCDAAYLNGVAPLLRGQVLELFGVSITSPSRTGARRATIALRKS